MSESEWVGQEAFFAALDKIQRAADMATKEVVVNAETKLVRAAQGNFIGSHRRGEPHVGGNRPNVVTGTTRRSIRGDLLRRYGVADYGTTVAPRVKWGRRLELGWRGSPGYPFFQPAVEKVRPEIRRDAVDIWVKNIQRAT